MEKVSIEGIILNLRTNSPVLVLKGENGRKLPISVGIYEAQSILLVLEKHSFLRPLTHDLFKSLFEIFSAEFLRLEIHSVKNGIYYAHMVIRRGERTETLDCRPSDGIAVALRFKADMFAEDNLMKDADVVRYGAKGKFLRTGGPIDEKEAEVLREMIDSMSPQDFWKNIKEK